MPGIEFVINEGGRRIAMNLSARIARTKDLTPIMPQLAGVVYESTRQWFNSKGEGTWPKLAPATIEKKAAQYAADPARPLYETGNLYESVTSSAGPYSFFVPSKDGMVLGVAWLPAMVLARGTRNSGPGGHTKIPARPIWPPPTSVLGRSMQRYCALMILAYISGKPVPRLSQYTPGARQVHSMAAGPPGTPHGRVGRGHHGRFVSLGG